MLGIIEVDKINLKLPVLQGATQQNMKFGAGHITGTAMPGNSGNAAIAAHRSQTYGKQFNRLDEIDSGDTITFRTSNENYQYKVYEKLVVTPEEVSILAGNQDEKTITLITCTPIDTATHRLIVKAKQLP